MDVKITEENIQKVDTVTDIADLPKINESKPNNDLEVVHFVDIPEDIAKRLSELMTIQSIRQNLLAQSIDNPETYDKVEKMLIPIIDEIEAIKATITKEYIPPEYSNSSYIWSYNGIPVDGSYIRITKV